GRGARNRRPPDRAPAQVPADIARDRHGELDDDCLPGPDRAAAPLHERTWFNRLPGGYGKGRMTPEVAAETELRRDPLSGRLVVVAPGRSKRPGAFRRPSLEVTPEELESCPFCAGREERTPPETLRLPGGAHDWQVRAVPHLYPAFAGQEVVIHTP